MFLDPSSHLRSNLVNKFWNDVANESWREKFRIYWMCPFLTRGLRLIEHLDDLKIIGLEEGQKTTFKKLNYARIYFYTEGDKTMPICHTLKVVYPTKEDLLKMLTIKSLQ
eukprot:TRINITY_DN2148_c0_g1_i2.p1 TRINITY_DN2148_c0_g1~~TRINITY_DN2148_c0_g1_i2.p1  ORF type:complete len:110 (+),score=9.93 TRINITY_DN2148_c0_g1_i2:257-586(+)